jgi:hypothetical protein
MLGGLKRAAKLQKIEFLDWLASSEGPAPSVSLRRVRIRVRTWAAIWLRRALPRQFSFPRPRRYLYLPASGRVKVAALRRYARDYGLETFVETGTYLGDTTAALASIFSQCFTIEMSPQLHARSQERLSAFPNVECVLGDSASQLPSIVSKIDGPSLFWLDAHASGSETVNSGKGPIFSELSAIYSGSRRRHIVLIDDARGHDLAAIRCFCEPCVRVDVRNDIVRLVPHHMMRKM